MATMDVRAIFIYENDFCHGCLSFGRRCSMQSDIASLFYQLLAPYNIFKEETNLILCWECEATLQKIRIFQYKVNKAQALLQDVITRKIEHKSLSTLAIQTKNTYDHTINSETTTTINQPSKECKLNKKINKLKTSDCAIKVPIKKNDIHDETEDIKINNYNYDIELDEAKNQEKQSKSNFKRSRTDKKYAVSKEEKYAFESPHSPFFKQEGVEVNIKKSENIHVDIKQELDNYSDDITQDDDNIIDDDLTQDISAEGNLVPDIVPKKYRDRPSRRIPRKRAKKTSIDYNNIDKYFNKIVLPPDVYKTQLNKWSKENSFKASKYKCMACALVFNSEAEKQSHKELHNNRTEHTCELCNLNFNSELELVTHGVAHEFYKCVICLYICRTPNAREGHLKLSHRGGYWNCDECNLSFRLNTELTAHRESLHYTFVCDYCNTKRNSKLNLQKHITNRHMRLKSNCNMCGKRFSQKRYLKEHLIHVHNVQGLSKASKESTYCVECNKQYPSMYKYRKHLRLSIQHNNKPKKKIIMTCPECGKEFNRKAYLNNHYKLFHGEGTKHRCDTCNKYFGTGFSLRVHITRVHKKIPLPKTKVCEECGLSFQSNIILIHHMRTHTGERPYECSHCDARFAQKYARDVHVRNRHLKHFMN